MLYTACACCLSTCFFHNPVQEADLMVRRPIFPALLRAVRAAEADDQFDSNLCPEHGLQAYDNS
jgi:hypothetical protein